MNPQPLDPSISRDTQPSIEMKLSFGQDTEEKEPSQIKENQSGRKIEQIPVTTSGPKIIQMGHKVKIIKKFLVRFV